MNLEYVHRCVKRSRRKHGTYENAQNGQFQGPACQPSWQQEHETVSQRVGTQIVTVSRVVLNWLIGCNLPIERAERKWAELHETVKAKAGRLVKIGSEKEPISKNPTLEELGVDKKESAHALGRAEDQVIRGNRQEARKYCLQCGWRCLNLCLPQAGCHGLWHEGRPLTRLPPSSAERKITYYANGPQGGGLDPATPQRRRVGLTLHGQLDAELLGK